MDMPPLSPQDAVAAGLIDGTAHKLDAMHVIAHNEVILEGPGQPGLPQPQQGACMTVAAAHTESLASQPADTVPNNASPSGHLKMAATPGLSSSSASRPVPHQAPFMLTSSSEKRAVMQELWDAVSDETRLELLSGPKLDYNFMRAELHKIMFFFKQGTKLQWVKETTSRLLVPVHEYAEIIRQEAQAAAQASATADTQPKSAVAVVHVEGAYLDCQSALTSSMACPSPL